MNRPRGRFMGNPQKTHDILADSDIDIFMRSWETCGHLLKDGVPIGTFGSARFVATSEIQTLPPRSEEKP